MAEVVVMAPAELAELVRAAVADALDERDVAPLALVDQQGLARALGVSTPTVRRLVREGLPELRVGDAPRYEIEACLGWLRGRRGGAP